MFITEMFVDEERAKFWHELGCQYPDFNIQKALSESQRICGENHDRIQSFADFIESDKWESKTIFKAGQQGYPFKIKVWKRYGYFPAHKPSKNHLEQKNEQGICVANAWWELKMNNFDYKALYNQFDSLEQLPIIKQAFGGRYSEFKQAIVDKSATDLSKERASLFFPGIQTGNGSDGEPTVVPINKNVEFYIALNQPNLFNEPQGIHGIGHSARVLLLCDKLSELNDLSDIEKKILLTAALWHDIGRNNDMCDDYHGFESMKKVLSRKGIYPYNSLSESDLNVVRFIVENHPIDDTNGIENIANYSIDRDIAIKLYFIFKDADALDRLRIGDLNPKYLRNQYSHRLIGYASELLHA